MRIPLRSRSRRPRRSAVAVISASAASICSRRKSISPAISPRRSRLRLEGVAAWPTGRARPPAARARISRARASASFAVWITAGPTSTPSGVTNEAAGWAALLLRRLLDRVGEVDVAQHRAGDAARRGIGLDDAQELALVLQARAARARPPRSRGSRRRRRARRRAPGRRRRTRPRRRAGPSAATSARSEPGLDADQVLQQPDRAALVRREEARPGGLLDVLAAGLEQVAPALVAAADLLELLDLVDQPAPLGLELRALLAHRARTGRRRSRSRARARRARPRPRRSARAPPRATRRAARARGRSAATERSSASTSARRPAASSPTRRRTSSIRRRSSSAARNASSASSSSRSRTSSSSTTRGQLRLDARELLVDGCRGGPRARPGRRAPRGRRSRAPPPHGTAPGRRCDRTGWRGSPARRRRAPRAAAARASAAASTSPSSPSSRSRAVLRSLEALVPARTCAGRCSRSSARSRAAASLRESSSASAVSVSCFLAISACCCSGFSWRRSSASTSCEPQQILVEPGELALGALLAPPVLGDAGGLLDVLAAVLGLGEQDLLELALAHHRVQRAADPGLAEQLLHVEQPHDLPVDPVLGSRRERKIVRETSISLIGTGILPAALSITSLTSAMPSAGRDGVPAKITSAMCPPRSARAPCSPEDPADRVDEVRLARAVGADDHRHAGDELQDVLVREGLEPADRDRSEEHRADANRLVILAPVGGRDGRSPSVAGLIRPRGTRPRRAAAPPRPSTPSTAPAGGPSRHQATIASTSLRRALERRLDPRRRPGCGPSRPARSARARSTQVAR